MKPRIGFVTLNSFHDHSDGLFKPIGDHPLNFPGPLPKRVQAQADNSPNVPQRLSELTGELTKTSFQGVYLQQSTRTNLTVLPGSAPDLQISQFAVNPQTPGVCGPNRCLALSFRGTGKGVQRTIVVSI